MGTSVWKSPDGVYGTLDDSEAADAQAAGYKPASQAEAEAAKHPAAAFAKSLAASATFGASDYLGKHAASVLSGGRLTPDDAAAQLSLERKANPTASELGNITGMLIPSPLELGQVAKLAVPARGLLGVGMRGALTGGLYGLGQFVQESVLDDTDATAEKALAMMGAGALTGGVAEGGLHALATGASGLMKRLGGSALSERLDDMASAAAKDVRKQTLYTAADLKKYNTDARWDKIHEWAQEHKIFAGGTHEAVNEAATRAADDLKQQMDTIIGAADSQATLDTTALADKLDAYAEKHETNALGKDQMKEIRTWAQGLRDGSVDSLQGLQDMSNRLRDSLSPVTSKALKDDNLHVRNMINDYIVDAIKSIDKEAGEALSKAQEHYGYAQSIAKASEARSLEAQGAGAAFQSTLGAIAGGAMFSGPGAVIGAVASPVIQKQVRSRGGYLLASALEKLADSKGLSSVADAFRTMVEKMGTDGALGQYRETLLGAAARGSAELLATHVGLAQTDPSYLPTMGLQNETPDAVDHYGHKLALIDALAAASKKADAHIDKQMKHFVAGTPGEKLHEDVRPSDKDFKKRMENLTSLLNNPQAQGDLVPPEMMGLTPAVSAEAGAALMRGAQFLLSKAPRDPYEGMPKSLRPNWSAPPADLDSWYGYLDGVERPMKVLEDMRLGYVRQEAAEGLKVTYPALYEQMRQTLWQHLSKSKSTLDYEKRMRLATVFGPEYGGVGIPELQTIQQVHAEQQNPPQPQGGGQPDGRQMTDTAKNTQTQSERLALRGNQ